MASAYLSRSASGGSRTTWTFSAWVKRSQLESSGSSTIFNGYKDGNNESQLLFKNDSIEFYDYSSSARTGTLLTNAKYRDTSAWYHIVAVWDTSNATAGDRMRLYVNGVEETSFATDTQPSSSQNSSLGNGSYTQQIGLYASDSSYYFDGSMTHIHFCDGYAYQASDFGETDSTSGIWKPKTSPSVTYGSNGFFLKMENSGAMGTDSSGNTNTFTVNGTITQTEDTPSNNFCTWNAINPFGGTLANGNLTVGNSSSFNHHAQGTLGMTSGKWYWEYKMGNTHGEFGICENSKSPQSNPQTNFPFYFLYGNGVENYSFNNATSAVSGTLVTGSQFSTNDIIGIAFDADNGKLYAHLNGTYYNSGNPASGTGELISGIQIQFGGVFVPFLGFGTSSARTNFHANFGNGYFGTSSVASSNSDSAGLGLFEYSVPSGYYSLCTKNIKNYG